jgi:hypothetical protein
MQFVLGVGARQFAHEIAPLLAFGIERRYADLDCGFPAMTARTKRLQIRKVVGELRVRLHSLDVIHLKPANGAAFHAAKAVTPKRLEA